MAHRNIPLISGEIYHVFNRSVARQPIFTKIKDLKRFLEIVDFYRFKKTPLRYSHYNRLPPEQKSQFLNSLYETGEPMVEILAFSIMPNHFHLLVKQTHESGIKLFISQIENSYAKYYNTKYKRSGALFQEMFKAVRIETDEQLIHVVRYIHLNPLTGYVIQNLGELEHYPWTSFIDYIGERNMGFLNKDMIQGFFSNREKFKKFTLNQVDYQKALEDIKHLALDES